MAENGLDLRTRLIVVGVFVMFFGFPAASIAYDLRKKRREQAGATVGGDLVPIPIPIPLTEVATRERDQRAQDVSASR